MVSKSNPWDIPEWHFVRQEAMLTRQVIGAGATALGQANYANKKGEYYRAFFELSVGLERLAKLALTVSYALSNNGRMPDEKHVRKFGHDLRSLLDAVEALSSTHKLRLRYQRPCDAVAASIIENLDAFADARRGRYANFVALGNPNNGQHEPMAKWWREVAETILRERYYGKRAQERVERSARAISALVGQAVSVNFTSEAREQIDDLELASRRTGQAELVQKWSRYHVLTIARWLSDVYHELSKQAVYQQDVDAFSGSWEFFDTYRVDDDLMKSRKIWPLD